MTGPRAVNELGGPVIPGNLCYALKLYFTITVILTNIFGHVSLVILLVYLSIFIVIRFRP